MVRRPGAFPSGKQETKALQRGFIRFPMIFRNQITGAQRRTAIEPALVHSVREAGAGAA